MKLNLVPLTEKKTDKGFSYQFALGNHIYKVFSRQALPLNKEVSIEADIPASVKCSCGKFVPVMFFGK